jgi:hypothetical protein
LQHAAACCSFPWCAPYGWGVTLTCVRSTPHRDLVLPDDRQVVDGDRAARRHAVRLVEVDLCWNAADGTSCRHRKDLLQHWDCRVSRQDRERPSGARGVLLPPDFASRHHVSNPASRSSASRRRSRSSVARSPCSWRRPQGNAGGNQRVPLHDPAIEFGHGQMCSAFASSSW